MLRKAKRKFIKFEMWSPKISISTSALALAINRDGSSGGIARLAVITKDGIERSTVLNPDLPKFFEN